MAVDGSAFETIVPGADAAGRETDYQAMIAGAIADLWPNSPKGRQRVYKHATSVLREKLRSSRPKLSRQQIKAELRALETAIGWVEAAAAPRAGTKTAQRPAPEPQPRGGLKRLLVPAAFAIVAGVSLTAYWVAGGHFGKRVPPAQVERAVTSAAIDPVSSDAANSIESSAVLSATGPLGCDAITAATDLVACAEASRDRHSSFPQWLDAYTASNTAPDAGREAGPPATASAAATNAAGGPHELVEKAKRSMREGDLDSAVRDLTAAIRADALYAEAYVVRGQAAFQIGDTERAIADFNEGIRLDPRNALAIRARGMTHLYRSNDEAALADLSKAIQLVEADPARMPAIELFYARRNRAAIADRKKLYDREIYDLTAMIDAYWRDPVLADTLRKNYREAGVGSLVGSIYRLRAQAHVRKGSPEAAIADLSFALQLDPSRTIALLIARGNLLETLGRRDAAMLDYRRILEVNPAHAEAKTAIARLKGEDS
jgi:tetratricopeptide (TPR) repeat protein